MRPVGFFRWRDSPGGEEDGGSEEEDFARCWELLDDPHADTNRRSSAVALDLCPRSDLPDPRHGNVQIMRSRVLFLLLKRQIRGNVLWHIALSKLIYIM